VSTHALRPWTDLIKLHPDVEGGALTEVVFAFDLGAIAANDPNVPVVNRDPEAFFRATYLTADLHRLLEEVLGSLAGKLNSGSDLRKRLRLQIKGPIKGFWGLRRPFSSLKLFTFGHEGT